MIIDLISWTSEWRETPVPFYSYYKVSLELVTDFTEWLLMDVFMYLSICIKPNKQEKKAELNKGNQGKKQKDIKSFIIGFTLIVAYMLVKTMNSSLWKFPLKKCVKQ